MGDRFGEFCLSGTRRAVEKNIGTSKLVANGMTEVGQNGIDLFLHVAVIAQIQRTGLAETHCLFEEFVNVIAFVVHHHIGETCGKQVKLAF